MSIRSIALVVSCLVTVACKGGAQAPTVQPGQAGGQGASAPAAEERAPVTCPEAKAIGGGDTATAEGTIFLAYKAALKGESGLAEFTALFSTDVSPDHIRREIWPRVIQHVSKYVAGTADPTWTLCRTVPAGPDRVKLFVKSNDPRKTDPPIVLVKQAGAWKIDVMTP